MNPALWLVLIAVLIAVPILVVALDFALPDRMARLWLALERSRSGMRPAVAEAAGFTMPYLAGGRGEPLVLVHGFGGDKDNFTRVARFLTGRFRVIAPDLPGFGEATRDADARYHIDAQVERLHAFVQGLGLGAVHLGGSSMGGFIAAQYAATYPASVLSLWLIDAAGASAARETDLIRHYAATGEMPLLVRREADYAVLLASVAHRRPLLPHSLRRALARRAVADFPLHTRIFREIGLESPPLDERYREIRAPALVVWGREDRILSPTAAGSMAAAIPRCRVIVMDATGHLPMIERPRAAARDYLAFRDAPP